MQLGPRIEPHYFFQLIGMFLFLAPAGGVKPEGRGLSYQLRAILTYT